MDDLRRKLEFVISDTRWLEAPDSRETRASITTAVYRMAIEDAAELIQNAPTPATARGFRDAIVAGFRALAFELSHL